MAAFTKYEGPAKIQINGRTIAEATSSTMRASSGGKPVFTMIKGLAGPSNGPESGECEIESAVPKAGLDLDFIGILKRKEEVEIVVRSHGKVISVPAWCDSWELRNSVDGAASFRTSWITGPATVR